MSYGIRIGDDLHSAITNITLRLITDWVSFRIAIEQGMGGRSAQKKERRMVKEIRDHLYDQPQLTPSILEELINNYLYEEFDTCIEDGTVIALSTVLVNLANLCKQGKINEAMSELPSTGATMPIVTPDPDYDAENDPDDLDTTEDEDESMDDEEEIEEISDQMAAMSARERPRGRYTQPDEEGWVTVISKKQ